MIASERAIHDLAIIGAGPAGAAAALEAHARGLHTVLIDEQPDAGGQVYRTTPGIAPSAGDADRNAGDALRAAVAASGVERRFSNRVWHVDARHERFAVHALAADGPVVVESKALVVATGALERHVPFAGWDAPGVMGLAAATVLLKAQRMLPGRNVVVAGAGPLLYAVAKGIVEGGGAVAAIVDARPYSAWWRRGAALAARPDLLRLGVGWMRTLRKAGVRVLRRHAIRSVSPTMGGALIATVTRVAADGTPLSSANAIDIACDTVCCGYGLVPATDVTRLLGVEHAFDSDLGGWHALVDRDQRTTVPRLYVAGDGAGILGAAAAGAQGRIAALAVAHDLARLDATAFAEASAVHRIALRRAGRFGRAMTQVAQIGEGSIAALGADVTVCLCERLSRATLDAAIDEGATTLNDLRNATRCGMGPCGGRVCEDAAARLVALRTAQSRRDVGQATGRSPLRPVEIDAVAGDFDYDSIPMPAPAPL